MLTKLPVFVLLIFLLLKVAKSVPVSQILDYVNERDVNSYHFRYRTSDFQSRDETGTLITKGEQQILVVKGYFAYASNGKNYRVTYEADEDGYRAKTTISDSKPVAGFKRIGSATLASLAGGGLG